MICVCVQQGQMCVTAHDSGCVLFHTLELANDPGLYKARSEWNTNIQCYSGLCLFVKDHAKNNSVESFKSYVPFQVLVKL